MIARLPRSDRSTSVISVGREKRRDGGGGGGARARPGRAQKANGALYSFASADSWTIARREEGARGIIETEITVETTRLGCLTVIGKRG